MKLLLLSIFFIVTNQSHADVWTSERNWTADDVEKFSKWIESDNYHREIFSSNKSPYYGIKSDCADAIVATKAIYSFENKLNFKLKTSSEEKSIISNQTSRFDHEKNPLKRLKLFIHFLGQSIGTETLARYNSYPIDPKEIRASDFYVSRWKTNGSFVRHAYMIKGVTPTGHFLLYSSTTPVKVRELEIREGMPLHVFKDKPWGFKRFLPLEIDETNFVNRSSRQYELLIEFGEDSVLQRITDLLKVEEDTLDKNLKRRVKNLCSQLMLREREINHTQNYLSKISNRCMNNAEYDEHSTPSRDTSLFNGIKRLLYGWKRIRNSDHVNKVSFEVSEALDYMLRRNNSTSGVENLNSLCNIRLNLNGKNLTFNLKNFFDLAQRKRLSYHPNDSIELRWGLTEEKTHCLHY